MIMVAFVVGGTWRRGGDGDGEGWRRWGTSQRRLKLLKLEGWHDSWRRSLEKGNLGLAEVGCFLGRRAPEARR